MYIYRNTEARSCNHCCSGNAKTITYYECVFVALGIQPWNAHEPYFHLWPVRLYNIFCTLSHKGNDFLGENLLNTKRVFWFSLQLLSQKFFILRRIQRDAITNVNFLDRFSKKKYTPISNFMKIRPVGAELFHADWRKKRRTGVTKPIVAFRNFANASKNIWANRKGKNDGVTPRPVVTGAR